MKPRIMYVESKAGGLTGPACLGRVRFSKTGATLYYAGQSFQSQKGRGFKSNYFDEATGDPYWISGPRKDGRDALYATHIAPAVDANVDDEYWTKVRGLAVPPPMKSGGLAVSLPDSQAGAGVGGAGSSINPNRFAGVARER